METLGLSPGLGEAHRDGDQGYDDDTRRVVVVVVTHPQGDATHLGQEGLGELSKYSKIRSHLEDVEGVQDLIYKE